MNVLSFLNKAKCSAVVFSVAAGLVSSASAADKTGVDPALPTYTKTANVSGSLNSIGSDTLNNLLALWAEKFNFHYPNVKIQVEGKGSSTAPPALIEGLAQIAPMSRPMKSSEIDAFEKKFGYKPTEIKVAVDALAVFVHKDNPIQGLTMKQVDAIFSSTRQTGAPADITTWGQLGLSGAFSDKPLSIYGRNSASGTYGFFKEHALLNGDFKNSVKEQPGSASVVQGISVDRFAIGYSGVGYLTAGVKALPLSPEDSGKFIPAEKENAYSGDYPLARFLVLYINKAPGKDLDPMVREFVKLILSKEGQEVVVKDGYFPLTASMVQEQAGILQ